MKITADERCSSAKQTRSTNKESIEKSLKGYLKF